MKRRRYRLVLADLSGNDVAGLLMLCERARDARIPSVLAEFPFIAAQAAVADQFLQRGLQEKVLRACTALLYPRAGRRRR